MRALLLVLLVACSTPVEDLETHVGPGSRCYTDKNGRGLCIVGRTLYECNYTNGFGTVVQGCKPTSCLNEIPYNANLGPCEGERNYDPSKPNK